MALSYGHKEYRLQSSSLIRIIAKQFELSPDGDSAIIITEISSKKICQRTLALRFVHGTFWYDRSDDKAACSIERSIVLWDMDNGHRVTVKMTTSNAGKNCGLTQNKNLLLQIHAWKNNLGTHRPKTVLKMWTIVLRSVWLKNSLAKSLWQTQRLFQSRFTLQTKHAPNSS